MKTRTVGIALILSALCFAAPALADIFDDLIPRDGESHAENILPRDDMRAAAQAFIDVNTGQIEKYRAEYQIDAYMNATLWRGYVAGALSQLEPHELDECLDNRPFDGIAFIAAIGVTDQIQQAERPLATGAVAVRIACEDLGS